MRRINQTEKRPSGVSLCGVWRYAVLEHAASAPERRLVVCGDAPFSDGGVVPQEAGEAGAGISL